MSEISSISGETDTGLNDLFMELDSYCLFEAPKLVNNQSTEGQFHQDDDDSSICQRQNPTQARKNRNEDTTFALQHQLAGNQNERENTSKNHLRDFEKIPGNEENTPKICSEFSKKFQTLEKGGESKKGTDIVSIDLCNYSALMKLLPKLHDIYNSECQFKALNSSAFWLMVCAEYFPRKILFEKYQCNDLLKRLNQLPIVIKQLKITTQDLTNEQYYCLNDINKANSNSTQLKPTKKSANQFNYNSILECEGNSRSYESISSKEQSIPTVYDRQQSEHIAANQCSSANNSNIIFIPDENQDSYSVQDDVNILERRTMLIEIMREKSKIQENKQDLNMFLRDESLLKMVKEMELDTLIEILEESEKSCSNQKELYLSCLQDRINSECYKEQTMFKDGVNLEDGLIDMCPPHLANTQEIQFIEMLKYQQLSKREKQIQQLREANAQLQISGIIENGQPRKAETQTDVEPENEQDNNNNINMEESACQICNEADSFDNNLIVFCAMCNISVHQLCYGIITIPSGDWVCQACIAFGKESQSTPCGLCPNLGGALKPTSAGISANFFRLIRPKFHQYLLQHASSSCMGKSLKAQVIWVHLTCAMWMPECYFIHPESSDGIAGIQNIDKQRFFRTCTVCLKKKTGSCLKCVEKSCKAVFHPECARRAGLALGLNPADTSTNIIYCQVHAPLPLLVKLEQKDVKKREEILQFLTSPTAYVAGDNDGEIKPSAGSEGDVGGDGQLQDKLSNCNEIVEEGNKEIRKKLLEEAEFMRKFSLHILRRNLSKLKKLHQSTQSQSQLLSLEQDSIKPYQSPKAQLKKQQAYLNTKLKRDDVVFQTFRFKSLTAKKLFVMYKRLIKSKKQAFSETFLQMKMEREQTRANKLKEPQNLHQIDQLSENLMLKCPKYSNDPSVQKELNAKAAPRLQKLNQNSKDQNDDEDSDASPKMRKYLVVDHNKNQSLSKVDVIIKLPLHSSSKLSKKNKIKVEYRHNGQSSHDSMKDDYEHCLTTSKNDKKINQNKSLFNERLTTKELCLSSQCHDVHSYSQEGTVSVADEDTKQQAGMIKEDDSFMQLLCSQVNRLNAMLDQKAERDQQKDRSETVFRMRKTPDGAVVLI